MISNDFEMLESFRQQNPDRIYAVDVMVTQRFTKENKWRKFHKKLHFFFHDLK